MDNKNLSDEGKRGAGRINIRPVGFSDSQITPPETIKVSKSKYLPISFVDKNDNHTLS